MVTRLFVPLSSAPHAWFRSGDKQWELRRYGRQYTESHLRVGRPVELRRGYTDANTSLWGAIESVQRATSLRDFFDKVPYAAVIPEAASVDDAVDQAARILGVGAEEPVDLIGFKLELDHVHDPVEA